MKSLWIGSFLLSASAAASAQDHGPFLKNFEEAYAAAKSAQKLLFVDFGHPW